MEVFKMERVKTELLKKYESRKPNLFIQYDGFHLPSGGDDIMVPDDKGYWCSSNLTYELMGGANVRVLICPNTPKENVLELLEEIMGFIKGSDMYEIEAKEELRKITKLNEIKNEMQKISEREDLKDVEYLFTSVKEMLDQKKQAKKLPMNITDDEIVF
jgi:hypothetical protein